MTNISFDFQGQTFFVSGGSRGIGRAIVSALAQAGANVAFSYKSNREAADNLVAELARYPGKFGAFQADTRVGSEADRLLDEIEVQFGELAGVVNNAGIKRDMAAFRMESKDWTDVIETNLNGTFYIAQAATKRFVRRRAGKILNVSSVSGLMGIAGQTNYCASKAAIIGFTKALAKEVARFDVQVNALAPGFIETDMLNTFSEKERTGTIKSVPMRRFGSTCEVAHAALYLLSQASNYVTGHTLTIDGGLCA